jgi:hypothetical protein
MRNLFLIGLLLFSYSLFSQKTEQNYFDKAAKYYYNGNYQESSKTIKEGLQVYPNNQKLLKLQSNLPVDKNKLKWEKFNNEKYQLVSLGYTEGKGGDGYTSTTLTDPNGKKRLFVKRISDEKTPKNPIPDPWNEFKKKESALLNSGYSRGNGNNGDEEKYLTDPYGEQHSYFKKKKAKKLTIDVGLKMPKQNYFVWNQLVSDEDLEVEIEIDNGEDNPIRERIPSNQNFFSFKTQNSRYDGVDCRVTLNIIPKDGITIKGKLTGVFTTKCGK